MSTTFLPAPTRAATTLRILANAAPDDPVFSAGIAASVSTLNDGIVQRTGACRDPRVICKHAARLRAALRAMATEMEDSGDE